MGQLEERYSEITEKQDILKRAKQTLKREFVGIDGVIDDVVDTISSWYLFPDIQEKPLVINLWGLTGVGKTSLVKRLSSLLGFEKLFYHFDLGEKDKRDSVVKDEMERIFDGEPGYPVILGLDEFQHARTIDDMGMEISNSHHRIVWQILDSGRFNVPGQSFVAQDFYDLKRRLNHQLLAGVEVRNGMVTSSVKQLKELRDAERGSRLFAEKKDEEEDLQFVSQKSCIQILEDLPGRFNSLMDVKNHLLTLDGPQTMEFLKEVIDELISPQEIDCSKALIFVMGNLDEAYLMSKNQNADISADEFHRESLKINIPEIKKALKRRFRSEHIARLGNHHIIYPAMSRRTFEKIIDLELQDIRRKAHHSFNIELHFHESLYALLYREGVYPTQGTRPLLTTIYHTVQARLGSIVAEMLNGDLADTAVQFAANPKGIDAEFIREGRCCHRLHFPQEFSLEKLRHEKRNDRQAITAVHESGHAVLSSILLHTAPKDVYSVTADVDSYGFADISTPWEYISRRELLPHLAMLLGGLQAEKVVFGEEHITNGSSSDLARATELASMMIKKFAMGSVIGKTALQISLSPHTLYDFDHELNRETRDLLSRAARLAEDTLRQQETLLLHMANYLSDHRHLGGEELIDLLKAHAVDFDTENLITDGDDLYYRKRLKEQVGAAAEGKDGRGEADSLQGAHGQTPEKIKVA